MSSLSSALERIRIRHNTDASRQLTCGFCSERMTGGYTTLQSHLLKAHGLLLPLFDNIDDIDGFINDLYAASTTTTSTPSKKFVSLGDANNTTVFNSIVEMDAYHLSYHTGCGGDEKALREQVRASPAHWSWEALPAEFAAKYRLFTAEEEDGDEDEEEDARGDQEGDDTGADGNVVVGIKEVGVTSDRIECPFCLAANMATKKEEVVFFSSKAFSEHLLAIHHIDNFVKAVKSVKRTDGTNTNFHMHIAIINLIRDSSDAGLHPHTQAPLAGPSPAEIVSSLAADADKNGVALTYLPSPSYLEATALVEGGGVSEKYLIPRRPNDPLITYFTQNDEGSDSGSDWSDDDAPAVPTVAELYKMKEKKGGGAAAASSSN